MKRFVVIMHELNSFENIRLLTGIDNQVLLFPRRKEAHDYIAKLPTTIGFSYRTSRVFDTHR